jgi:hypothetical protein
MYLVRSVAFCCRLKNDLSGVYGGKGLRSIGEGHRKVGRKISEFYEKLEPELGCNFTDLQVLSECQFIPQIKIESLNATYRKLNRQRSVFPSEVDLLKAVY